MTSISQWLEQGRFNAFQWRLFLLGVGTFAIDGYCLFVYGAAVPLLLQPFHIDLPQAGVIGSYAPIGAALGALVFGMVADRIGRNRTIVLCIAIFCSGMLVSGLAGSVWLFSVARLVTGFGVGGCMPNMVALATEYAPLRNRSTMVSMMLSGIQVGSMLAALIGLWLFAPFGWRSVFIAGGLPLLLLVLYVRWLPESPAHLLRSGQLDRLRALLRRARPDTPLPEQAITRPVTGAGNAGGRAPLAAIFRDGRGGSTLVFWLVYLLNLYTIYGFTIWLPKLLMNRGYSLAFGLTGLLTLSIVSIAGSYVAGLVADRLIGSRPTLFLFYSLAFLSILATGYATHPLSLMLCVSLAGAGFNGAQNCLNAYIALYYPPRMRSTAMGMCYGIGRLGSILGPAVIGYVLSLNLGFQPTLLAIAIPGVIPALAIFAVRDRYNFAHSLQEA